MRARGFLVLGVILIFGLIASGCGKKPAAVVNGEPITEEAVNSALNERLKEHGSQGLSIDKETLRKAVIEQLIADRLIIQGASELKISVTDAEVNAHIEAMKKEVGEEAFKKDLQARGKTIEALKKQLKEQLLISKFIENLVPEGSVKEDEIKEYYRTTTTPFLKPESIEVRFIQTTTKEEAEQIMKSLRAGKNFDSLADSLDKEKKAIVSNYGWTQPEFYGPEIASALKSLKKGEYGGPYTGKDAFYIIRLRDRQPQRPETLDEALDKIENIIMNKKRNGAIAHWVSERRAKSKIVVN
jgi:parvulin-like peptidyl-prolyl isomerase